MVKNAKVIPISLKQSPRTIVLSDIHGNLPFLRGILEKVQLQADDTIIFLGDMLEKGKESLATLRYIQSLQKSHRVFLVSGNWEAKLSRFFEGDRAHGRFFNVYLPHSPNSLLFQMAKEAGLPEKTPLLQMQATLRETHKDIRQWLGDLPTILEAEDYVFVHAGLYQKENLNNLQDLEAWSCMKYDGFLKEDYHFPKYVVVGHTPSTLYHYSIPDSNPIIDQQKKIISIDGACVLKLDGQLNALILEKERISWEYYDGLPQVRAIGTQNCNQIPINIRWGHSKIEILKQGSPFSLCQHLESGRKLQILNEFIRKNYKGQLICEDSTDYLLPVEAGDVLSVNKTVDGGFLGKKNGVTGWYFGEYEPI